MFMQRSLCTTADIFNLFSLSGSRRWEKVREWEKITGTGSSLGLIYPLPTVWSVWRDICVTVWHYNHQRPWMYDKKWWPILINEFLVFGSIFYCKISIGSLLFDRMRRQSGPHSIKTRDADDYNCVTRDCVWHNEWVDTVQDQGPRKWLDI